jgi:ferrous iron transport protein A
LSVLELQEGQKAIITKVSANDGVKSRLQALGVVKNETIKLLKYTFSKETYEIEVGRVKVALRKEEASAIEVELI